MADVSFESTPVGADSAEEEVVFVNEGAEPLTLSPAKVTGADAPAFPIAADSCGIAPLEPGESCSVVAFFRPQRLGAHGATLEVAMDGEPDPLSLQLSGEGIPWLRITPEVLDFGAVPYGMTSQRELWVENVSGRTISVAPSLVSPTRPFLIPSHTCGPGVMQPGSTCRVQVQYTATGPGQRRLSFRDGFTEIGSVILRGTLMNPPGFEKNPPTPDASAHLGRRLRIALARLRAGRGARAALLRRGLVVRGIVPPARGRLGLVVRARRSKGSPATLVAVRRRQPAQAADETSVRARLTRAGRRLLRSGRRVTLDVRLTHFARSDQLVSSADRVLRLGRAPDRAGP
jgi:hypothetical protein